MDQIRPFNADNHAAIARTMALLFDDAVAVPPYIRDMLIQRLLWAVTENDNEGKWVKYDGQPYWSVGALRMLLGNLQSDRPLYKDLRHEHAVPKKVMKKEITGLSEKDVDSVLTVLTTNGYAVVVSKEEDRAITGQGFRSKMPEQEHADADSGLRFVLSRYTEAGIEVCDVRGVVLRDLDEETICRLRKEHLVTPR